jgi:hypothetical protein
MLAFWMARVLTKPFDQRSEKFRSTFVIDFVSSGLIGLLYTLIVGPLIEGVASAVGHALYPVVPIVLHSLDVHEYTPFQRHMRPLELLLVAGATWWSLNRSSKSGEMPWLGGTYEEPEADPKWNAPKTMLMALGVMTGYLAILAMMFSLLEPQDWPGRSRQRAQAWRPEQRRSCWSNAAGDTASPDFSARTR